MTSTGRAARAVLLGAVVATLIACQGKDSAKNGTGENSAPVITGDPPTTVRVGEPYTFTPRAIDSNGDTLRFSASHLPLWAGIDPVTGVLSGTPVSGDERTYADITITVSDGRSSASLPAFSIVVSQNATGSAMVSWVAPTRKADGSLVLDLAAYRIEYGRSAKRPDQTILIDSPAVDRYVVDGLSPGRWYFGVVAISSTGFESQVSKLASKTIN